MKPSTGAADRHPPTGAASPDAVDPLRACSTGGAAGTKRSRSTLSTRRRPAPGRDCGSRALPAVGPPATWRPLPPRWRCDTSVDRLPGSPVGCVPKASPSGRRGAGRFAAASAPSAPPPSSATRPWGWRRSTRPVGAHAANAPTRSEMPGRLGVDLLAHGDSMHRHVDWGWPFGHSPSAHTNSTSQPASISEGRCVKKLVVSCSARVVPISSRPGPGRPPDARAPTSELRFLAGETPPSTSALRTPDCAAPPPTSGRSAPPGQPVRRPMRSRLPPPQHPPIDLEVCRHRGRRIEGARTLARPSAQGSRLRRVGEQPGHPVGDLRRLAPHHQHSALDLAPGRLGRHHRPAGRHRPSKALEKPSATEACTTTSARASSGRTSGTSPSSRIVDACLGDRRPNLLSGLRPPAIVASHQQRHRRPGIGEQTESPPPTPGDPSADAGRQRSPPPADPCRPGRPARPRRQTRGRCWGSPCSDPAASAPPARSPWPLHGSWRRSRAPVAVSRAPRPAAGAESLRAEAR